MERTTAHIPALDLEAIVSILRDAPNGEALVQNLREALGSLAPAGMPFASPRELRLRLLGAFAVGVGDRWENGPPPMRGRYLIQFLALHRGGVASRERLHEALWPDLESDDANRRLHIAVSGARTYLRRALGGLDAIGSVRGGYAWNPEIVVNTDVEQFLQACAGGRNDLIRAKKLYAGELLATESDEWIEPLRVRCAAAYVDVLERLADDALGEGDYSKALGIGLELVAFDRGHEGASRLVMRCFAALGRRGRALAEYEALRAHLRKHLGLEATAETRQVIRAILGQAEPDAVAESSAAFKA